MNSSNMGPSTRRVQSTIDRNSFDVNRLSAWYEDFEEYENTIEEITNTTLDQSFQDEMQHVNQWFSYLTDAEKTATIYTLLQHSSQVQIKFFIHLLQEMKRPKLTNRAPERHPSSFMNLNIRQPVPQQSTVHTNTNRHSFALGDTEQLTRMLGSLGTDWLGNDTTTTPQLAGQPTTTTKTTNNATIDITTTTSSSSSSLRPRSVIDSSINPSFSSSWLSSQPAFNDNVIKRPRSADISSWTNTEPSTTWQRLNNQHDNSINFQQWKEQPPARRASSALTSNALRPNSFAVDYGKYNPIHEVNKETQIDMNLIKDVPAWFKSMRLHKYNAIFGNMRWQDIIKLNDQALELKGVAALGARRKMLKIFDSVKEHCRENGIEY